MSQRNEETREYAESDVLHFPKGLVGLPELRRWIMVDMEPTLPMKWLVSLDKEGFRVPVTDPGFYSEKYSFEIDDGSQKIVQADDVEDIVVMIISTVGDQGQRVTGNLSAPLVVNVRNRKGIQCVLESGAYGLSHEIDQVRFGEACQAYASGHPENVVGTAVDKAMTGQYDEDPATEPLERDLEGELVDAR
jgi:flagellar assembly factor FliW